MTTSRTRLIPAVATLLAVSACTTSARSTTDDATGEESVDPTALTGTEPAVTTSQRPPATTNVSTLDGLDDLADRLDDVVLDETDDSTPATAPDTTAVTTITTAATTTEPPTSTTVPSTDSAGSTDSTVSTVSTARDLDARVVGSLTEQGRALAERSDWSSWPSYAIAARIDAGSGRVEARMNARIDTRRTDVLALRWFPGVVADDAEISAVSINGRPVEFEIDESLVTVELGSPGAASTEIEVAFGFTAPAFSPAPAAGMPSGDGLDPAEMGLLARSEEMLTLGHWFPVWIPDGFDAEPALDGYGDISNYPAATIVAELAVTGDDSGEVVVTSGIRLDSIEADDGSRSVIEGGVGLRDLAVMVVPDAEQRTGTTDNGIEVVVTGPPGTEDVEVLSDEFGDYPWTQIDVVAAPLASSVGGMEWPGMVWIESTIFSGGLPGLGDAGDLSDLGLDELDTGQLDDLGMGDLLDDLGLGDIGLTMESTQEWVIAHEVGHMWWFSLIGTDSITSPVIDEPLAQHSACLVVRVTRPEDGEEVCDAQTSATFGQMTSMLGVADAPADQRTDEFDTSLQYGAVVYGKAPNLYRALEEEYGTGDVTGALAEFVDAHAFEQVTTDDLRTSLGESLGDPAGVDAMWQRWFEEVRGVEDLGG
ncbi:MAG: hypothetical protein M3501_04530 [Actinomycetota bacterium]|nr:hypothetical protein [Actinomycetota bacterium]